MLNLRKKLTNIIGMHIRILTFRMLNYFTFLMLSLTGKHHGLRLLRPQFQGGVTKRV